MTYQPRCQVVLLPAQLSHLAEEFPEGGAIGISQAGSVVSATNGQKKVVIDSSGRPLHDSNQETHPKC